MAGSLTHNIKNICVFGGSSPEKEKKFLESWSGLAERKTHLVYGGGNLGLIENVSTTAFWVGSQVLAINPNALSKENITGKTVGEELKVLTMSDWIVAMLEHFDAFTAILVDSGILEEIFHISSWTQLNIHRKPISLLNVNDFYNNLLFFLNHVVEQKFITSSTQQIIISAVIAE